MKKIGIYIRKYADVFSSDPVERFLVDCHNRHRESLHIRYPNATIYDYFYNELEH